MMRIKVPATTANIGPGYDCLGLALSLYNEITIEKQNSSEIAVIWECENPNISLEENLFYTSIMETLKKYSKENLGGKLTIKEINIPVSRGLGSSASCIVAGIYSANYLMDNIMSLEEIINLATEMEGHPDNVVPAILGNMVLSTRLDSKVIYSIIEISKDIQFKVLIPDFKLSTSKAREVLPKSYRVEDVISNASRLGLLINFLQNKKYENIRICLDDKLHQPYRFPLINNSLDIFEKSKELGALGEFISGAGPSLISLVDSKNESFDLGMKLFLNTLKDHWNIYNLEINNTGTIIETLD